MSDDKIYGVLGYYRNAREWARDQGFRVHDPRWFHVRGLDTMRGRRNVTYVWVYGTQAYPPDLLREIDAEIRYQEWVRDTGE